MSTTSLGRFKHDEFVVVQEGSAEPELSMLMPIYRQERYVGGAVRSVIGQQGVACEIIISDDHSGDRTFERALATVEDATRTTSAVHRVVMRRGRQRLGRAHVHLLAAHATCDVVAQAHGDDIARPDRASRLLEAMERTGAAMASSVEDRIDESGVLVESARAEWTGNRMLSLEEVIEGPGWLIGATECWSRSALTPFGPLEVRVAPTSHDRIMPVRAWFAGGVVAIGDPLLQRRMHRENWGKALLDHRSAASNQFGSALRRMCLTEVLLSDLAIVESRGMATSEVVAEARRTLVASHEFACRSMREAYGELEARGLVPLWVNDAELRLATEGVLGQKLARRALMNSPLRRTAGVLRRLRARTGGAATRLRELG